MQNISRGGYSREEILDVLHSKDSARNVRFRYVLLDKNGFFKKELDTVKSGEVSMSAFSTIKRTAKFTVKEEYIPAYWTREQEASGQINYEWDNSEFQNGIFSGDIEFNSTEIHIPDDSANNYISDGKLNNGGSTWSGTHPDWTGWGTSAGSYYYTSAYAYEGYAQRFVRSASGSFGMQTTAKPLTVTNGTTVYVSFLYKPRNDPNDNFGDPTYVYLMKTAGGNDRVENYTITNKNDGWKLFEGSVVADADSSCGLLVAWYKGSNGEVILDNVYMGLVPARYYGEWQSNEVDVSMGYNATYVNSDIWFSDDETNGADVWVESSVSLDGGQSWSSWSNEGTTAINGFSAGDDMTNAMVRFRVRMEKQAYYDNPQLYILNFWVQREYDVLIPETTEINYLSDRIQPFMEVRMPDGFWVSFPLGVFLLSTPTRHDEVNGVYRDIEAYDGLIILDDDKFTSRYNIPAGTKYTEAVKDILDSAGINQYNIQDKGDTLSSDMEFKIGTSKLEAVNKLLSSINYVPVWVDASGYFTSYQYESPADRAEDYVYADDELSVIYNGMEEELDLTEIANTWVVTQSNPEDTPLVSTKSNDSEDSPTSTVNMGRTVVDFREIDDISDQASLDAYVERIAFEDSQVFGKLKFTTALMPFHEYYDVIRVKYDALKIDYKFAETSWTMKLEAGGEMEHEVRRVVDI